MSQIRRVPRPTCPHVVNATFGSLSVDNVHVTTMLMTTILRASLASCVFFAVCSVPANELSGTVRDVCGPVLPGTAVSVANGSGAAARVAVDGSGHYSFNALAPGQWTITFTLSGFQTLQQEIWLPQHGDAVQLNVRLLPDLLMKQELMVTHGDPAVRYRRYSVHGVIRARSGEPIPAATIRLQDVASKKSVGTHPCTTDELGRYAITDWSPIETTWQLSVQAEGFRSYTHPDFRLRPDEPRAIDLHLER